MEGDKEGSSKPGASTGPIIQLNDTKAGMEGLDVDAINNIINEASKGSKFYEHKVKQQKEIAKKLEEMRAKLATFSEAAVRASEREMDTFGEMLERSRNYDHFVVHIDMDAFYAAVEMRDNPDLKDKPMAVGGKSMLATSNYVARKFGVRAAMPGFIAVKLCPKLIIVPPNFDKYKAVSKQVHNILKDYDPNFSSVSLDEAYLDITHYVTEHGADPEEVVREIRRRIFEDTKLTASAGLASNGFLAKIAGDICKPNNQYYLPKNKEAEAAFVNPLKIRKINGIGATMEQLLQGFDVYTAEDIWKKRGIINLVFKPLTAKWLLRVSKGYDDPAADHGYSDNERKSMSSETTLKKAVTDVTEMLTVLEEIANELEGDLKKREMKCKQVAVKVKTDQFEVRTRSTQLPDFTDKADDIFKAAKGLLEMYKREDKDLCVRLLGIRLAKWDRSSEDSNDEPASKQRRIDAFLKKPETTNTAPPAAVSMSTSTSTSAEEPLIEVDEITSSPLKFKCPLCDRSFAIEKDVSEHVDQCLVETGGYEGSSQPQPPAPPKSLPKSTKSVTSRSPAKHKPSKKPVRPTSGLMKYFSGSQPQPKPEAANHSSLSSSTPTPIVQAKPKPTTGETYSCPVCSRPIISLEGPKEVAYSEHVIDCLSGTSAQEGIMNRRWCFKSDS